MVSCPPMALPTPTRMHRQIATLRALLADLDDEYRWAYDLAYGVAGRSVPESGGTRNPAQIRPTENAAVADAPIRDRAQHAADRVQAMMRDTRGLVNTLLPKADRTSGYGAESYPRTITTEERKALEHAQRKRTQRGAGWGTS